MSPLRPGCGGAISAPQPPATAYPSGSILERSRKEEEGGNFTGETERSLRETVSAVSKTDIPHNREVGGKWGERERNRMRERESDERARDCWKLCAGAETEGPCLHMQIYTILARGTHLSRLGGRAGKPDGRQLHLRVPALDHAAQHTCVDTYRMRTGSIRVVNAEVERRVGRRIAAMHLSMARAEGYRRQRERERKTERRTERKTAREGGGGREEMTERERRE